jgi:hypothetical protein
MVCRVQQWKRAARNEGAGRARAARNEGAARARAARRSEGV